MNRRSPRGAGSPRPRRGQQPLADELRRILHLELVREAFSADRAAGLYAVSRRTLIRNLKAEGSSFRKLTNEVRCEIACMLLAETDLSVRQIAEVLNYSEHSAFARAFRRWTGQNPSAWRSSHRGLAG